MVRYLTFYNPQVFFKTKHNPSFTGVFSVTFGKRMSKIVVSFPNDNVQGCCNFCYILCDTGVIQVFAARQRDSLQVLTTR